jgi:hypothetical protein
MILTCSRDLRFYNRRDITMIRTAMIAITLLLLPLAALAGSHAPDRDPGRSPGGKPIRGPSDISIQAPSQADSISGFSAAVTMTDGGDAGRDFRQTPLPSRD